MTQRGHDSCTFEIQHLLYNKINFYCTKMPRYASSKVCQHDGDKQYHVHLRIRYIVVNSASETKTRIIIGERWSLGFLAGTSSECKYDDLVDESGSGKYYKKIYDSG